MTRFKLTSFAVLALTIAALFAGCSKTELPSAPGAAEPAARVNDEVIATTEVDRAMEKLGDISGDRKKQAAAKVLNAIIDQRLAVQAAVKDKLDQDEKVKRALEAAHRQVLAQAYLEHVAQAVPAPTEQEIKDYYGQHPELFSERRVYRLQELNIQAPADKHEEIRGKLTASKNLGEFAQYLKDQGLKFRAGESVKAAEQLPLEILPQLHKLKDGQAAVVPMNGTLTVLVVAASQTQVMSEEQAKPVITQFLENRKKQEAATGAIKKLKETAKIEYLGQYAETAEIETPKAAESAEGKAPEAAAPAAEPAVPAVEKK
jgi:EpsD family peptidyl-prolyl cis-trans isomerase